LSIGGFSRACSTRGAFAGSASLRSNTPFIVRRLLCHLPAAGRESRSNEARAARPVTRATKAASMLGAGLAADTVRKLFTRPPNTASAKAFLRDAVAAKQDELRKMYVDNADEWIKRVLVNHVIATLSVAIGKAFGSGATKQRYVSDQDLQAVTVRSQAELRDYTVEDFLFPGAPFSASNQSAGMRSFMVKELQGALLDFNRQYDYWIGGRSLYIKQNSNYDDLMRTKAQENQLGEEYARQSPFDPQLRFTGVPAGVKMAASLMDYFVSNPVGKTVAQWKYAFWSPEASAP
jgi:hypothetical protein